MRESNWHTLEDVSLVFSSFADCRDVFVLYSENMLTVTTISAETYFGVACLGQGCTSSATKLEKFRKVICQEATARWNKACVHLLMRCPNPFKKFWLRAYPFTKNLNVHLAPGG